MRCGLLKVLSKLSKSSLEAVDDEGEFDDFKKYMHISERPVEVELREKIRVTNQYNLKKLILVCGNVGDGKSHLISVLKNGNDQLLKDFKILNDATSSILPNLSPEETLQIELEEFDDEHIDNCSHTKILLAVNLGTLSKFLDSEEGKNFTCLKAYVESKNILSQNLGQLDEDIEESFFSYVNFSDYHLYFLTRDGVYSPYIGEIFKRVFIDKKNEKINNPFLQELQKCKACEYSTYCPVKMNFEILQDEKAREQLEQIIIEAIIKKKLLISTRALFNFIYDILVPNSFSPKKNQYPKNKEAISRFLNFSLPNILFDSKEKTPLLQAVSTCDKLQKGGEELDQLAAQFHIAQDVEKYLKSLSMDNAWIKLLCQLKDVPRDELYWFYVRMGTILGKAQFVTEEDELYKGYVRTYYLAETGKYEEMEGFYEEVKSAIYRWNGTTDEDRLGLGVKGKKYMLLGQLELKADVSHMRKRDEKVLKKFGPCIHIAYKKKGEDEAQMLAVDYDLYNMIMQMKKGYQPGLKDESDYVSFARFVKKIENFINVKEEILIKENRTDKIYKIKENDFGKLVFKTI